MLRTPPAMDAVLLLTSETAAIGEPRASSDSRRRICCSLSRSSLSLRRNINSVRVASQLYPSGSAPSRDRTWIAASSLGPSLLTSWFLSDLFSRALSDLDNPARRFALSRRSASFVQMCGSSSLSRWVSSAFVPTDGSPLAESFSHLGDGKFVTRSWFH